jgi:hypothetical protein
MLDITEPKPSFFNVPQGGTLMEEQDGRINPVYNNPRQSHTNLKEFFNRQSGKWEYGNELPDGSIEPTGEISPKQIAQDAQDKSTNYMKQAEDYLAQHPDEKRTKWELAQTFEAQQAGNIAQAQLPTALKKIEAQGNQARTTKRTESGGTATTKTKARENYETKKSAIEQTAKHKFTPEELAGSVLDLPSKVRKQFGETRTAQLKSWTDFQVLKGKAEYSDTLQTPPPAKPGTPAPAISDEDKQAIDWARQNASDPRSAQILKLHNLAQ